MSRSVCTADVMAIAANFNTQVGYVRGQESLFDVPANRTDSSNHLIQACLSHGPFLTNDDIGSLGFLLSLHIVGLRLTTGQVVGRKLSIILIHDWGSLPCWLDILV